MRRTPGLYKTETGIWKIDKRINGYGRLQESTGCCKISEAEKYLDFRLTEIRNQLVFGKRPKRIWREAATRYLNEYRHKRSIIRDAADLEALDPFIGDLELSQVHMETLNPFIQARRRKGLKSSTVNRSLAVCRRILNLSARLWRDKHTGLSWLETVPMIQTQDWHDARRPHPLSWEEQARLLKALPDHLSEMALFGINTGLRNREICGLRWDDECDVPELNTSVFVIPAERHKNGQERLVVLNRIGRSVVKAKRGEHREYVFTYTRTERQPRRPLSDLTSPAWNRATKKMGLRIRPHDLRHTFGRRLRSAGVSLETRKALLGHKNGDVTTHYSAPEIQELLNAVELIAGRRTESPTLTLIRRKAG